MTLYTFHKLYVVYVGLKLNKVENRTSSPNASGQVFAVLID